MGHTHYNELANDGQTIYAATRSIGQVEEGPPGFSVTTIDNGVVSWKFKPIEQWPIVMITSPADQRLIMTHRARRKWSATESRFARGFGVRPQKM